MKPLLRVPLWTLLVFSSLLKISQAQCVERECGSNETKTLTTTTTTVTLGSTPNCALSIRDSITANGSITALTPGAVYQIFIHCVNCCTEATTKPGDVGNLNLTDITTSSISLMWTKPTGHSSFYRVQWTGGNVPGSNNVSDTSVTITGLTAGVQYEITVTAVADDNSTEGQSSAVSQYTRPGKIGEPSVSTNTSSISLNWPSPPGEVFMYRVEWHNGGAPMSVYTNKTFAVLSDLIPGTSYTVTVTAVAGDNQTEGDGHTFTSVTKPEVVGNLEATKITTSSVFLSWTEPEGKSSFYRVQWTDGNMSQSETVNKTDINITELTAGQQYTFTVVAVAGDEKTLGEAKTVSPYTKPDVVRNLTVTNITTSSISLMWTKPLGKSSFYRVQWTGGNVTGSDTSVTITGLTAGVQYEITVTAVADDNSTEGQKATISKYIRPGKIGGPSVSTNTSSISLNWPSPPGEVFMYRVEWHNGGAPMSVYTNNTFAVLSDLIPGTSYTVTVTAVAGDNQTEGDGHTFTSVTKPEVVGNLEATKITTSSISLMWTKPLGTSSFYRVQWTDGNVIGSDNVSDTSVNITNLTAGVQYEINVTAVADDNSTEGQKVTVSKYTKPAVVRNLTVSEITTSSVFLSWTEPEGKSSFYRVQWTDGNMNQSETVNKTDINITELTAGQQYTFAVVAVAGDEKTLGEAKTVSPYTKPDVVRNLTVTNITTSSISLMWTKPLGKSSFYRVQWTGGNVTGSDTSVTITGLTAGVQYEITVTAVADDNSTEGQKATISKYIRPGKIGGPSVSTNTSSISLNWTSPPGEVFMYRVEWHNGGAPMSVYTNNTFAVLSDLIPGTSYTITVTAVAGDNQTEGDGHTFTSVTKPEVVGNLEATKITTSSISLMWTKPLGNISFYRVQWTGGNVFGSDNVSDTSVNITNLTAGVQYEINVTAVADDNSTEGQKVTVSKYTKPAVVRNLTVSEITTSSVFLSWTEPEGKSSFYRVQWTDGNMNQSETVNKTDINITELTAGQQYTFAVVAVAGDEKTLGEAKTVSPYTKPDVVRNLTVTNITTSSISLMWTKPLGKSSFYRVQWTDGNVTGSDNVSDTSVTITGLTAGVQYEINVTAVAEDNSTEGQSTAVSKYTKPGKIGEPSVSTNTSSISLNWPSPPGEVFMYRVEWHNGAAPMSMYTNKTFAVLSDLIPGTSYTITITAVAEDDKTEGDPYTFTSVTVPAVVRSLSITDVTASSVSLDWTEPEGNATSYTVQWTAGGDSFTTGTTNETSFIVNKLIPGFQYNITVAAVAENPSNTGEGTLKTTFTRPVKPENITIAARGTNYLTISWTLPEGRVDHYAVKISNEEITFLYSNKTADTTALFTDLHPGRIFAITVTSVVGNFSEMSDQSSFATVPTPPGSITISQRTNSSLHLDWGTPAMMEGAPSISYHITYQPEGGNVQSKSALVNNTELSSLLSGTSYNITVETVGPQDLRSTIVSRSSFTLPNPVLNLVANPKSTTSVYVQWSDPQGAQVYYKYLVQTYSAEGAMFNTTVSNNSADVSDLEPGTRYNINVTTIAAAGSESTVEQTFSYTMPKAVTNLTAEILNTTAIRLTWLRQSDHKPSYSYLVTALQDNMLVHNDSTETETYTFFNLTPGELYTFDVFTVVAGVRSAVESISSHTTPEAVSDLVATGSTTMMSVSWTAAVGRVGSYTVLLSRGSQLVKNDTVPYNATKTQFSGLTPGVLYCAVVVTRSGPLENNSTVCNATFPNPPGPITVDSQTVESINFTWPLPENMDHHQYNFSVSSFNGSSLTGNNWFLLDALQSGSRYNISVVTVGVWNYESTAVMTENYTRPHAVTMLRQTEITTDSVTLEWEQPQSKPHYSYEVQTSNGSFSVSEVVSSVNKTITGLSSGSSYSFTVTTRTADGTEAAPVTVSYFTRPYSVGQLEAKTLNTTAIRLVWRKPLQYKPEYRYRVETTGCGSQNKTVAGEVAEISALTPGTECSFCVFVQAENGTKGEANCTSQYTKPEAVQPSISSEGSNSSVLVSWTKPPGGVERYMVYLNSSAVALQNVQLDANGTSYLFDNLTAGRLYTAAVTTYSGPFNASSGFITNATFPNPPGPIDILTKTNSSIEVRWQEAPLMSGASFHYQLTYISPKSENYTNTTKTSHNFATLLSGTPYNISVATVGVMGFESEKVQIDMVTTRPFSVKSLQASPNVESVFVKWVKPDEDKDSYCFNVTWQTSNGPISSKKTKENNCPIKPLVPGTYYNLSVTTETSDGTKGASEWISTCTNAGPVINLRCNSPNTPNATVLLSWDQPKGLYSGFQITLNDGEMINSTCCNHTVSNLRHNTRYTLTVETESCGEPSTPQFRTCLTGITNPPIPDNYKSLVLVSAKEYNKFTLLIDSDLLNNINGPITNVGVLVTKNVPGDTSNLTKYLGKTYSEWKNGDTPVYLATVATPTSQSRSGGNELNIEIGDESKFEGYTNGALDANGKYQYAIVLFTDLSLQNGLVNGQMSLMTSTDFFTFVTLPQNPAIIGIAIGVTLGIFCVLFIILIGFIIYWKRLSNKESSDIQIHSLRAKVSVAVRVEDYEAYYKKQKADSNCGFAEEFEDLKLVGTGQAKTSALSLENKPKNRYNNVLSYDSSRVKLSIIHGSPYDDYINANYMPGYNSRKEYIAAQGPLPTTVSEFWRMIWEKNVQTLVMLTRCNEQGRVKCEQYWDHGTKHFDNITVTTTSDIPLEDWTIREFDVKNVKTAETRSVRQFHFTAWPDHGVPQTTELLISFRHLVREHMDQYSRNSPTVVHCSAGVGRTGTFIAIDRLIFQVERENIVDVYGIVHDLRMHRNLMVQTEDQYVFLNQCALDIIRARTGTNVDLIYQNTAALSIYENVEPKKGYPKNGYHNS